MCRFCLEHGAGRRWYLETRNYSAELLYDLERRGYIVSFLRDFGRRRARALSWAALLERAPELLSRVGRSAISARMQRTHFGQPVPIEECAAILRFVTSIVAIPCVCRLHAPGKRHEAVCLVVTATPVEALLEEGFSGYERGPELSFPFDRLRPDEALALLERCEERGLMHSVWTFRTPFIAAICNCDLSSGCMAMRMTVEHRIKLMWRGEQVARIDPESCTRCGACAALCPFGALDPREPALLDRTRCWGCGICRRACPAAAIRLEERASAPDVAHLW